MSREAGHGPALVVCNVLVHMCGLATGKQLTCVVCDHGGYAYIHASATCYMYVYVYFVVHVCVVNMIIHVFSCNLHVCCVNGDYCTICNVGYCSYICHVPMYSM